jgi:hypothetical protein
MKRNLIAKIACLLVGIAAFGTPAGATLLYFNDFESNSTADFSGATTLLTAPNNVTTFLGPLSAGATATLTLNGVSAYPSFNLIPLPQLIESIGVRWRETEDWNELSSDRGV